jgi:hypothetical protein
VALALGVVVGRIAQALSHQAAPEHASAGALSAGLLGQRAPACRRLPVRPQHLDAPTPRVALTPIARAPGQVRGHPRARGRFSFVGARDEAPLGVVGADRPPRPAHQRSHCRTAAEAAVRRGPGRRGPRVRPGLVALLHAAVRLAAARRAHRHATAPRRGAIANGRRAIERLRRAPGHPAGGVCRCAWGSPAPRECWWGGIVRMGWRVRGPLLRGDLWRLEGLLVRLPGAQLGSRRSAGQADGAGEVRRDHQETDQALPPAIAPARLVAACVQVGPRGGGL